MSDLRDALEACRGALEIMSSIYGPEGTIAMKALNKADAALAQPSAVEPVFLGSPDPKAVSARLRGYANESYRREFVEVPRSLLFEAAQLLTTPPIAPDGERMRRALETIVFNCTISTDGNEIPTGTIQEVALKALSRADDGKESEGGEKAGAPGVSPEVEDTAPATGQSVGALHPSDPTPPDATAQREAIARIVDPKAFQKYDDAYSRKDRHDQMSWIGSVNAARKKADAILALQTRAGG